MKWCLNIVAYKNLKQIETNLLQGKRVGQQSIHGYNNYNVPL